MWQWSVNTGIRVVVATLTLLLTSNPTVAQSFSAETLLHHERFPDPGTRVSARKGELITGFELSVVDVQVLRADAVDRESGRTVAFAGALLHAVEVEDLGRVYCGPSGSGGKPSLDAIGAFTCLRDADGDGSFDRHFLRHRTGRREPYVVDAVMNPARLKTPVEYSPATPEQTWSTRLELYSEDHRLIDWQGNQVPIVRFRFERRLPDGTAKTYTRNPWLGDANPARIERTMIEVGACFRVLNSGDEFNSTEEEDKPLTVLIEQPGSFFRSVCKRRRTGKLRSYP